MANLEFFNPTLDRCQITGNVDSWRVASSAVEVAVHAELNPDVIQ